MNICLKLAKAQLLVNKRRSLWTLISIVLSATIIMSVYGLAFGSGLHLLDQMIGSSPSRAMVTLTVIGLASILSILIIIVSMVVVSNSFRVSANERTIQFGMLKSVGAISKQINYIVMYEALFLSLIGIPIGIIIGLLFQWFGVEMINFYMIRNLYGANQGLQIHFILSMPAVTLALLVSFFTIMISAYLPALKASKASAIESIRGCHDVKVKNKKVIGKHLILKLFRFEGLLANTFLTRSSKHANASMIALTMSVVLVVSISSLFSDLSSSATSRWWRSEFTTEMRLHVNPDRIQNSDGRWSLDPNATFVDFKTIDQITQDSQIILEEDAFIAGIATSSLTSVEIDNNQGFNLTQQMRDYLKSEVDPSLYIKMISVDSSTYNDLKDLAGIKSGNILLNGRVFADYEGRRFNLTPIEFTHQTINLNLLDNEMIELKLDGEISGQDVPLFFSSLKADIVVVVDDITNYIDYIPQFIWLSNTYQPLSLINYINTEHIHPYVLENNINAKFFALNHLQAAQSASDMISLIRLLAGSFTLLLVAIALTNVISSINENVKSRYKEFATLQSVGMSVKGIKRMLLFESVFCSVRALLIGLPLGTIIAFSINQYINASSVVPFSVPYLQMMIVSIVAFLFSYTIMCLACKRLKSLNVIETIRNGNAM